MNGIIMNQFLVTPTRGLFMFKVDVIQGIQFSNLIINSLSLSLSSVSVDHDVQHTDNELTSRGLYFNYGTQLVLIYGIIMHFSYLEEENRCGKAEDFSCAKCIASSIKRADRQHHDTQNSYSGQASATFYVSQDRECIELITRSC